MKVSDKLCSINMHPDKTIINGTQDVLDINPYTMTVRYIPYAHDITPDTMTVVVIPGIPDTTSLT